MDIEEGKPLCSLTVKEFKELTRSIVGEFLFKPKTLTQEEVLKGKDEETFTITELALFLRCSKVTIHNYKKDGLPFYRIGRKVIFKKSEVLNFMSQKKWKR